MPSIYYQRTMPMPVESAKVQAGPNFADMP